MTIEQEAAPYEGSQGRVIAPYGGTITLIKWSLGRDGWTHEIVHGVFRGRLDGWWQITIDGVEQRLRVSEWAEYRS